MTDLICDRRERSLSSGMISAIGSCPVPYPPPGAEVGLFPRSSPMAAVQVSLCPPGLEWIPGEDRPPASGSTCFPFDVVRAAQHQPIRRRCHCPQPRPLPIALPEPAPCPRQTQGHPRISKHKDTHGSETEWVSLNGGGTGDGGTSATGQDPGDRIRDTHGDRIRDTHQNPAIERAASEDTLGLI